MKSLKDFNCGWIIHNVDMKKGKNSQFFGEIAIKASPPIWISQKLHVDTNEIEYKNCNLHMKFLEAAY